MDEQKNSTENFGARIAENTAKAAGTVANATKAAAKAATGDVAGAVLSVLKDENMRRAIIAVILIVCFLITGCCLMVGSAITGAIEAISRTWSENWQDAWEQQGIASNGNAMYLWSTGWIEAGWDSVVNTITDLFETNHTIDDRDAMNQEISPEGDNRFEKDDFKTTIDALLDQTALVGENGALMKRIKMLKGRILERGKQLLLDANAQYLSDAMGISVATYLQETLNNPLLFKGIGDIELNFDMDVFTLSDIQAIKLLAAYSIQHDCDLTSIGMWDLMDYAGWFDFVYTGLELSDFGAESIYRGTAESLFGTEIGGIVHAGQDASTVYQLEVPNVAFWRGTFAPQWYYEELEQVRRMNKEYYQYLNAGKTDLIAGKVPIGVNGEDDDTISTIGFAKLNTFTPYGLVDKLFSTGSATLTITHTEYENAQDHYSEAMDNLEDYPDLLEPWAEAYEPITVTTAAGHTYSRSEKGIHSYTLTTPEADAEYYLLNTVTNNRTENVYVDAAGKIIIFDQLTGNTLYEVYQVITKTVEPETTAPTAPPGPTKPGDPTKPTIPIELTPESVSAGVGTTVPETTGEAPTEPEVIVSETKIDSFTTAENVPAKTAYTLDFSLDISYVSKSIDELVLDLMGLWPGSLSDTEIGSDGNEYARGHKDDPLFLKNWTEVYVDTVGNTHILQFERMQGYQYEAYMDLVIGFAKTLGFNYAGLYEPDYGYGDTIVSVAQQEADYYLANNISGGARYWNICNAASGEDWGTTQPWCVCFVNACAYLCGYIGPDGCWGDFNGGSWIYYCSGFYDYMVRGGYADGHNTKGDDYKPVPGDLIFYGRYTPYGITYDHIGIVKTVKDNGDLITLEGNVSKGNGLRNIRVAKECDWYINYQIGTEAYTADITGQEEQYYVVAYLHPHYPSAYNTDAYYLDYTGLTAPVVKARVIGDNSSSIILAGVGRFRQSQLLSVYGALKTSYPELCTTAMQQAIDNADTQAFLDAWNQSVTSKQDAWKAAQLNLTAKLFIRPIAESVKRSSGFDWTATDIREELLWAIVTTTDKQNALTLLLNELCASLDNNIGDQEFLDHLKNASFLIHALESNRQMLWGSDPSNAQASWIESIEMVLNKVDRALSS